MTHEEYLAYQRRYREEHREELRAKDRERYKNPEMKEWHKKYDKEYREKNKDKIKERRQKYHKEHYIHHKLDFRSMLPPMANIFERWVEIDGTDGWYYISDQGNVWSCKRGRYMKNVIHKNMHAFTTLQMADGKKKTFYIHQLVAKHFIPNPNGYTEIDHIDTDPANNVYTNLRWVTHKENMNNPITKKKQQENGSCRKNGLRNRIISGKNVQQYDDNGTIIAEFESLSQAAAETGIRRVSIKDCCKNRQQHAGGYRWKYA